MSPAEWDAIPWHEHQMYLEGFEAEGLISHGDPDTPAADIPHAELLDERVHKTGDATITERDYLAVDPFAPDEFAGMGIQESTIG